MLGLNPLRCKCVWIWFVDVVGPRTTLFPLRPKRLEAKAFFHKHNYLALGPSPPAPRAHRPPSRPPTRSNPSFAFRRQSSEIETKLGRGRGRGRAVLTRVEPTASFAGAAQKSGAQKTSLQVSKNSGRPEDKCKRTAQAETKGKRGRSALSSLSLSLSLKPLRHLRPRQGLCKSGPLRCSTAFQRWAFSSRPKSTSFRGAWGEAFKNRKHSGLKPRIKKKSKNNPNGLTSRFQYLGAGEFTKTYTAAPSGCRGTDGSHEMAPKLAACASRALLPPAR